MKEALTNPALPIALLAIAGILTALIRRHAAKIEARLDERQLEREVMNAPLTLWRRMREQAPDRPSPDNWVERPRVGSLLIHKMDPRLNDPAFIREMAAAHEAQHPRVESLFRGDLELPVADGMADTIERYLWRTAQPDRTQRLRDAGWVLADQPGISV